MRRACCVSEVRYARVPAASPPLRHAAAEKASDRGSWDVILRGYNVVATEAPGRTGQHATSIQGTGAFWIGDRDAVRSRLRRRADGHRGRSTSQHRRAERGRAREPHRPAVRQRGPDGAHRATQVRRPRRERIFPGRLRREQSEGSHDLLQARPPRRAVFQVPARQRVRGLVRDALHDGDVRGRRRRGRDDARHAHRLHPDDRTSATRPTAPSLRQTRSDLDRARFSTSPISTSTSRGFRGCTAERPGPAPATTSANPSTSATSSTGTPPAWARVSRTSTSARTCGSATPPLPSTDEPVSMAPDPPSLAAAGRLRLPQRFPAARHQTVGERRVPARVPVHRDCATSATIPPPTVAAGASPSQFVQKVLGGDNKLAFQYGSGGGNGLRNAGALLLPRLFVRHDLSEFRLRVRRRADHSASRMARRAGGVGVFQRDDLGTRGAQTDWYSAGGRVAVAFTKHAKVSARAATTA